MSRGQSSIPPAVAAEAPKHDFTARFFGYPDRPKLGLQGFCRRFGPDLTGTLPPTRDYFPAALPYLSDTAKSGVSTRRCSATTPSHGEPRLSPASAVPEAPSRSLPASADADGSGAVPARSRGRHPRQR